MPPSCRDCRHASVCLQAGIPANELPFTMYLLAVTSRADVIARQLRCTKEKAAAVAQRLNDIWPLCPIIWPSGAHTPAKRQYAM